MPMIYQCGHGPHNRALWAAGWTPMVQIIFKTAETQEHTTRVLLLHINSVEHKRRVITLKGQNRSWLLGTLESS